MGMGQEASQDKGLARSMIAREGRKSGQGAQAGPGESLGEKGQVKPWSNEVRAGVGRTSLAYQRPMHLCEPYPAPSHGSKVSLSLSLSLSHSLSLSPSPPLPCSATGRPLHTLLPADEVYAQKMKYKAISEELDNALNDITSL
ncbi:unnamed protein product [Lepidochelys olivacea]